MNFMAWGPDPVKSGRTVIITRGCFYRGKGQVPTVSSNEVVGESCLKSELWEDKDGLP